MNISHGKLPNSVLEKIFSKINTFESDKRVLQGPGIGEDTAHISFGSKTLIVKTDPITFVSDNFEWYSLHVNANDIVTSGAIPKWFLATILLPIGITEKKILDIFKKLNRAAKEINVTIVGGHTEITLGLSQPIICGTMLGEIEASKALTTSNANIGDDIIMYGYAGIEGTSILAGKSEKKLLIQGVEKNVINKAKKFIKNPGISIIKPALAAASTGLATSMHDVTEGGICTALNEISKATKNGVEVYEDKIPILKETSNICNKINLDPLGLISSGALLITTSKKNSSKLINNLHNKGYKIKKIGEITSNSKTLFINSYGKKTPIKKFYKDEIVRFFERS